MPLVEEPIETQRLILRPFTLDDTDAAVAWETDPDVMRWLGIAEPRTAEMAAREFAQRVEKWSGDWGGLAVVPKESGTAVGWCGIKPDTVLEEDIELFYALGQAAWGKGYATEASRPMLRLGFEERGLERIIATIAPDNQRSRRVAEKLGMQVSGRLIKHDIEHLLYVLRSPA